MNAPFRNRETLGLNWANNPLLSLFPPVSLPLFTEDLWLLPHLSLLPLVPLVALDNQSYATIILPRAEIREFWLNVLVLHQREHSKGLCISVLEYYSIKTVNSWSCLAFVLVCLLAYAEQTQKETSAGVMGEDCYERVERSSFSVKYSMALFSSDYKVGFLSLQSSVSGFQYLWIQLLQ